MAVIAAIMVACRSVYDSPKPVTPPTTSLFVTSIDLSDAQRLGSRVSMRWSATDADGFVAGYRVFWGYDPTSGQARLDSLSKRAIVNRTDSVFIFNTRGNNLQDIYLTIQAVDNNGVADPNPPEIRIPIRNLPPRGGFFRANLPIPDTNLTVITLPLAIEDPDGVDNLSRIEISTNKTDWYTVPRNTTIVTLVAANPNQSGSGEALVYLGQVSSSTLPQSARLANGFNLGARNRWFVRGVDISGAIGGLDSTKSYVVNTRKSDLLMVRSYEGFPQTRPEVVLDPMIRSAYRDFDEINLTRNGGAAQPKYWDITFRLLLRQYDKVIWYTDINRSANLGDNTSLLIETATPSIIGFLNRGGKLMMSSNFQLGTGRILISSPLFSWVPMQNADTLFQPSGMRILNNTPFTSHPSSTVRYPRLQASELISAAPLTLSNDAKPIYQARYNVPNLGFKVGTFAAKKENPQNGRTNLIFFSADLPLLGANRDSLQLFMSNVFNQEFAW